MLQFTRCLVTLSFLATMSLWSPLKANAVVVLYEESFDTDTANAEITYPDFTLSGSGTPTASVSGGVLNLSGGNTNFTIPGYSGDVVIEGDMGGVGVSPGGSRAEFILGGVRALFHVGYGGGAFRLEGNVAQANTNMGFTPAAGTFHNFSARSYGNGDFDIAIQNGDSPFQIFNANFTDVASVGQPIGFRYISAGTGIFDNLSVRYAADLLADPAVNSTITLDSGLSAGLLELTNNGLIDSELQVTGFSISGPNAAYYDLPGFAPSTLTVGGANNVSYDMLFTGDDSSNFSALLTLNTNIGDFTFNLQSSFVPEPSSFSLLGLGALLVMRRRRHQR